VQLGREPFTVARVRALLLANSDDCDAGFTGERFRHHGYSFIENLREHPHEWAPLDGIDLVVLLGSEWSVYWPEVSASVSAEVDVIRAAHGRGVPIYGICFGAQAIAAALGGTVERASEPEIGWYDNIASDLPEVIPPGPWMQWHSDVVTVPPGAVELARSPLCSQAYRTGRSFATQFHPEVNEAMITRWAVAGADVLAGRGSSVEALRAETSRNVALSRPNAEHLVDWFLDHVAGAPRADADG
jgi:GMP synthase-like glutamine amidotransferase